MSASLAMALMAAPPLFAAFMIATAPVDRHSPRLFRLAVALTAFGLLCLMVAPWLAVSR